MEDRRTRVAAGAAPAEPPAATQMAQSELSPRAEWPIRWDMAASWTMTSARPASRSSHRCRLEAPALIILARRLSMDRPGSQPSERRQSTGFRLLPVSGRAHKQPVGRHGAIAGRGSVNRPRKKDNAPQGGVVGSAVALVRGLNPGRAGCLVVRREPCGGWHPAGPAPSRAARRRQAPERPGPCRSAAGAPGGYCQSRPDEYRVP